MRRWLIALLRVFHVHGGFLFPSSDDAEAELRVRHGGEDDK
jgi:hypothetical protein